MLMKVIEFIDVHAQNFTVNIKLGILNERNIEFISISYILVQGVVFFLDITELYIYEMKQYFQDGNLVSALLYTYIC